MYNHMSTANLVYLADTSGQHDGDNAKEIEVVIALKVITLRRPIYKYLD